MQAVEAFVASDFAAFQPEKWTSNTYNRQRQTVKEKLRYVGQLALAQLGDSFTVGTSPEYPCQWNGRKVSEQWLFALLGSADELRHAEWVADQERPIELLVADPLPEHKHLCLAICLDEQEVRVSLILWRYAAADKKNLAAYLAEPSRREEFLARSRELGAFTWLDTDGAPTSPEAIAEAVTSFEVRQSFSREDVLNLGAVGGTPGLSVALEAPLRALLPLYRALSWSASNDLANIGEALHKAAKRREEAQRAEEEAKLAEEKQREVEREREREAAILRAHEQERVREHQRHLDEQRREEDKEAARIAFEERRKQSIELEKKNAELRKTLQETSAKKREEQKAVEPEKKPVPVPERRTEPERRPEAPRRVNAEPRNNEPRHEPRPEPPKQERAPRRPPPVLAPAAPGTLKTGDRVQLLGGPFSGKIGVIQEIDHKREAKISLGMMSVKAPEVTLAKHSL